MIAGVIQTVGRWAAPDAEEELWMVGHVLKDVAGLILMDPPVVPGLPQFLMGLGPVRAMVLTTHDHTRGSRYLNEALSCPRWAPAQANRDRLKLGRVMDPGWFDDGAVLLGRLRAGMPCASPTAQKILSDIDKNHVEG